MKEVVNRAREQLCIELGLGLDEPNSVTLHPDEFSFSIVQNKFTFPEAVVERERKRLQKITITAPPAIVEIDAAFPSERESATPVYDWQDYGY